MAAGTAASRRTGPARRLPTIKTAIIAGTAYAIAIIFLLPYIEMLITALRPQRELLERNYLPNPFAWSNLTNMWGASFGNNTSLRVRQAVAAARVPALLPSGGCAGPGPPPSTRSGSGSAGGPGSGAAGWAPRAGSRPR